MRTALDKLLVINEMFPNAKCELDYQTPFQLAIAVMLSAQTTDVRVNMVTKDLFKIYNDAYAFNNALVNDIELAIKSIGLAKNKARYIKEIAKEVVENYHGVLPNNRKDLENLPGIGRKSTNVILSECFNIPAIAVDTHVERVSKRLKLVANDSNVYKVEETLKKEIPKDMWIKAHHLLIFFGRYHCKSRNPNCDFCKLFDDCSYYQSLEVK